MLFRRALKSLAYVSVGTTLGSGAYIYADEGRRRAAYTLYSGCKIGFAYAISDYQSENKTEEEKKTIRDELDRKYAPIALKICTDLGGYYIKTGQTICGTGLLSKTYEDTFSVLLDDCPSKDFETIKGIVESELGKPISEAFISFDPKPLAAGSIGQVHKAVVQNGDERSTVVVKVQYPEVEKYFNIDITTMKWLVRGMGFGEETNEMMDKLSESFKAEFDYLQEKEALQECKRNLENIPKSSKYHYLTKRVYLPKAYDELCSRKVLTQELIPGISIKKKMQKVMRQMASDAGKTVAQFKADLAEEYKDPIKLREAMSVAPVSEFAMGWYIAIDNFMYFWKSSISTCASWLGIGGSGEQGEKEQQQKRESLLNGPEVIRIISDVHAIQMLQNGVYNSDPHAGNIMIMPDNRIGLIDYGGVAKLSVEKRLNLAKVLLAISNNEPDEILIERVKAFGIESEKMNRTFMLAYTFVMFHRGFHPEDLDRAGVPEHIGVADFDTYLNTLDKFKKLEGHIFQVQRCLMVLLGVASEIGATGISIAELWKTHAQECVDRFG